MKTRSLTTRPGILLVGAGEHGFSAVLPGILSMADDLNLVGVVESHAPNRQRLAAAQAQVQQFNDLAAGLAATNPAIVYLASLPEQHLEQGLLALAHGCHVVCEKPLTPSVADTARLVEAAGQAGRLLVTPFLNRYRPHYRCMREWILAGAIGRVEAIHFQHYWYGSGKSPAERLAYYAQTGGSLDCGIHYLDLARFVAGDGTWKNITAMGRWFDEPDMAFPVAISIQARFDDGPIVTYNDSIAYHELRTLDIHHKYVLGTAGMIVQEPAGIRLIRTDGTGDFIAHHPSNHAEEIPWLLADLLATMEGRPTASGFLPTGRDVLIAQEVVAEAHRQALRHRAEVSRTVRRASL